MPINPLIPLQVQGPQINTGGLLDIARFGLAKRESEERTKDREQNRELTKLKITAAKINALDEREKRRLGSSITGALQLNTFLQSDDLQGAEAYLQDRRARIVQAQSIDPELDTRETDDALRMLQEDPQALKKRTAQWVQTGQSLGLLDRGKLLNDEEMAQQLQLVEAAGRAKVAQGVEIERGKLALQAGTPKGQAQVRAAEAKATGEEQKLSQAQRTKTATIEAARANIDNSLASIDRLLNNPELDNVLGPLEGTAFWPSTLLSMLKSGATLGRAGDTGARTDAIADIETIQSQQFINNLIAAKEQGATFGALTEREGERLVGFARSLNTRQSEKQFRENLAELRALLTKARSRIATKHGVPDTTQAIPAESQPKKDPLGILMPDEL